jgi:hypothetical protein
MSKSTAAKAQKSQKSHTVHGEQPALVRRYGQIGISAVAAAVRYQGAAKNPAYAPALPGLLDLPGDTAA